MTQEKVARFLAFRSIRQERSNCLNCGKPAITFDTAWCASCLITDLGGLERPAKAQDESCFLCLKAIGPARIMCSSNRDQGIQPAHKTCLQEVLTSELTAIMVAIG